MDSNVGFGAAVNVGVRHLDLDDDDVIIVLNPDTRATPGALEALAGAVQRGEFDLASPLILTGDLHLPTVWFAGGRMDLRRGETVHVGWGQPPPVAPLSEPVSFLTGTSPAMTRKTWRELGGFREDLFLYWEDADLSLRAQAMGKRMGIVGSAVIWHAEGGSAADVGRSVVYHYYMQRNRLVVLGPLIGRRRLLAGPGLLTTMQLIFRALSEPVGKTRKAVYSMMGIVDGVRGRTGARVLNS
jgi:GT2 family glycosyltransferase